MWRNWCWSLRVRSATSLPSFNQSIGGKAPDPTLCIRLRGRCVNVDAVSSRPYIGRIHGLYPVVVNRHEYGLNVITLIYLSQSTIQICQARASASCLIGSDRVFLFIAVEVVSQGDHRWVISCGGDGGLDLLD
jgi:hypothetical protein